MLLKLLHTLVSWVLFILSHLGLQSNQDKLKDIERRLLKACKRFYEEKFVVVEHNIGIRTVIFNTGVPNRTPVLLLHGLGNGLCFWLHNVKELSKNGTVYAIDLPGFGRSSKLHVRSSSGEYVEMQFVLYLEQWRQRVGIEKFVMVGHDFGGYIATLYTLVHPTRISHLVLYEPWGFPILPFGLTDRSPSKKGETKSEMEHFPPWLSKIDNLFHFLLHLSTVFPLVLPAKWICDLGKWCMRGTNQNSLKEYQHLCKKIETKSGKIAYDKLSVLNVWARDPLVKRIINLDHRVRLTFIFGSKSWFDHRTAYEVKCSRSDNQDFVNVHIIEGEGKAPIHVEKSREFEQIILSLLEPKLERYNEYDEDEGWMEDDWITYDLQSSFQSDDNIL